MHVLAFFGIFAIVVTRIALPPAEPVQPRVMSAASLAPEQRDRAAAGLPFRGTEDSLGDLTGEAAAKIR